MGNAFADWKGSLMNEFRYKNINLSILMDGQYGGEMYSQTSHKNNTLGKTKVTLPGRDAGIIGDGVVKLANGTEFGLPANVLRKLGVQKTSIAIWGRDLFNFTKFPGFDPEGGNLNNGTLTPGVELTQFPSNRLMGTNLTFKF
jgi:hypothetical protein